MPNFIDIARGVLLEPAGLQDSDLDRVLDQLLSYSIGLSRYLLPS